MPIIKIKRVYEPPLKQDDYRILVDRLWPRGLTREEARIDDWAKLLAPSVSLRKWFGHDPDLWYEFQKKYNTELKRNKNVDLFIESHMNKKGITLLFGAKDINHTHAIVLKDYLEKQYEILEEVKI